MKAFSFLRREKSPRPPGDLDPKVRDQLAKMVRETPVQSSDHVLNAVRFRLALYIWGLESAEKTLEYLTFACNSGRADNLYIRLGFDALSNLPKDIFK